VSAIVFSEKDLDTIAIDTLYKTVRAIDWPRTARKKFQWWRAGQTRSIRRNGSRAAPCTRSSVR